MKAGDRVAGRYDVVGELGRGGMGVVLRAFDREVGREVALKLYLGDPGSSELLERFEREGRIAASLRHAHIVPVHDFGSDEGRPYLAYALIEGATSATTALFQRRDAEAQRRRGRLSRPVGDSAFPGPLFPVAEGRATHVPSLGPHPGAGLHPRGPVQSTAQDRDLARSCVSASLRLCASALKFCLCAPAPSRSSLPLRLRVPTSQTTRTLPHTRLDLPGRTRTLARPG
jgi:hypothetical protein